MSPSKLAPNAGASDALSVSQCVALINDTLADTSVVVEGEVREFKQRDRFAYFTLRDSENMLYCFALAFRLRFTPQEGMLVRVAARVSVYGRFGKLSLQVEEITPVGEGALQRAYEELKRRLTAEGLFDPTRKRSLPAYPRTIGLITSQQAAAYSDFVKVAGERWAAVAIALRDVHVQGREAVEDIIAALQYFNTQLSPPDLIVITRGGGSTEELHAFNDERLVRAIYASAVPVLSAVGHERDITLADLVADARAATPSNAAELAVPSAQHLAETVAQLSAMLNMHLKRYLRDSHLRLSSVQERFAAAFLEPRAAVATLFTRLSNAVQTQEFAMSNHRQRLVSAVQSLRWQEERVRANLGAELNRLNGTLTALSPQRVLERGYSVVRVGDVVVRDSRQVRVGQHLHITPARGAIDASVTELHTTDYGSEEETKESEL